MRHLSLSKEECLIVTDLTSRPFVLSRSHPWEVLLLWSAHRCILFGQTQCFWKNFLPECFQMMRAFTTNTTTLCLTLCIFTLPGWPQRCLSLQHLLCCFLFFFLFFSLLIVRCFFILFQNGPVKNWHIFFWEIWMTHRVQSNFERVHLLQRSPSQYCLVSLKLVSLNT